MRKGNSFVIIIFLALNTGISCAAEEGRTINLKEGIEFALSQSHEVTAFRDSLMAQKEEIGIARSFLLPKVAIEERFLRTNNPTYAFMAKLNQQRFSQEDFAIDNLNTPSPVTDYQTSFSFEQPLFARKASIGLNMARLEFSAKSDEYMRKREETAHRVVEAYLSVKTAKEYIKVAEMSKEDAMEHLRIAKARNKEGLGLYSDILRASTAVTEADQRLVSTQKNLNVAKRMLGLILGLSEPVDISDSPFELALMDITHYINASSSRKDIKALESRYENAKNNVSLAKSGYLPVAGLGGTYQLNDHRRPFGAEGDSWILTAFLRWELFDGTKREHECSRAMFRAAEAEEYLKTLKNAISFKIHEAYLAVEEARKNKELSITAMNYAEEGRRLVKARYENHLSPLVDLLDAQVSLDHARASRAARENEYILAIANLSFEGGTILKDLDIE
jgi:outer membrane protein